MNASVDSEAFKALHTLEYELLELNNIIRLKDLEATINEEHKSLLLEEIETLNSSIITLNSEVVTYETQLNKSVAAHYETEARLKELQDE